ncbi:MAG: hypothetical protein F4Y02_17385 [Chloroflexi bacterium]|nr:hypothetical protein [Chloroflexota bacterium]
MAWTNPLTWETEQVVSASDLNTHLRDNLKYMKGRVLAQWPAHALAIGESNAADGPDVSSVISGAASEYLFADDADQKVYGYFAAPQDFAGDTPLVVRLYWSAAATTGTVRWKAGILAWGSGEAMTGSHAGTGVTADVSTTTNQLAVTAITITNPGIAANDLICLEIERQAATNTPDTMSGDARLHFVQLEVG